MTLASNSHRAKVTEQVRNWIEQKPIYLDTETTGLDKASEIIEIGIVDWDGSILYQSYVKPARPIPPSATAVHHITQDMVTSAPSWPAVWAGLRPLIYNRPIGIYNSEFDLRMMKQSMEQYRLPWREKFNAFDVMQYYSEYQGVWDSYQRGLKRFRLEDAGRHFNIALPNAHRATDDSLLTRAVMHAMAGLAY